MWFTAVAPAAVLALLGACRPSPQQVADGDDPLAALTTTAESHRYTAGYWREQARTDAAGRWAKALAYCGDGRPRPGLEADGAKPNCAAVSTAASEVATARAVEDAGRRLDAFNARTRALARDPVARKAAMDSVMRQYEFRPGRP
ncbi:hypothetical protein tb265_50300 [Gemmatimonadetes bacterium T265]|nr:hypothetical protein tb265_50300 [Gemmatimonadetes bacterium T265]